MVVLIIILCIVLLIIWAGVSNGKKHKKIQREGQERGAYDAVVCIHMDGLGIGNENCRLLAFNQGVQIESLASNNVFLIPNERIIMIDAVKLAIDNKNIQCLQINYTNAQGFLSTVLFKEDLNALNLQSFAAAVSLKLNSLDNGRVFTL